MEKNLTIKNLIPGLVERGKIKIGIKGEWRDKRDGSGKYQLPQKLDHFVITGSKRDDKNNFIKDEKIHEMLGEAPTEIPIYLLYNEIDLNFQTRYACYTGARLFCHGDGEKAHYLNKDNSRTECGCPCNRQEPTYTGKDKCKINGSLSCIITGADIVGGVWKFRTTSYNSVVQILGSLSLIKRISGGYLSGLPLFLTLRPKTVTSPTDGRVQTVYVVGVEFRGNMEALQAAGYKRALKDTTHNLRIDNIETEARRLISSEAAGFEETAAEVEDEFYPDAAAERHKPGPGAQPESGAPELTSPESGPPAETDKTKPEKKQPEKKKTRGRPAKDKKHDQATGPGPGPDQGTGGDPGQGPGSGPAPDLAQPEAPAESAEAPPESQGGQGGQGSEKLSLF